MKKIDRNDRRKPGQLRPVKITAGYLRNTPESVLIETGNTVLVCAATVEEKVPPFLKGKGKGWITAEYGMLPRSGGERIPRENFRSGRSLEISRLIGRSLRMSSDMNMLGERTITVDCDVLQADGGTRTAAVTGGWVALNLSAQRLVQQRMISKTFVTDQLAAVSAGMINGSLILDLCYAEDSVADVDMNVVALKRGGLVEVQGTAEKKAYTVGQMDKMIIMALEGINKLFSAQNRALRDLCP